ncbi:MAG: class I SAM-dependent methyltransferase [Dokdonella sp.]|uniref:class I SAM-dependent methyltransferase n=1 Tax=Dokdonella sp. TaxID=2291710 RepID=UPI003F7F35CA
MPHAADRDIARRVARRYRRPWHRDYARAKVRMDPVYAAVADVVDDAPLLDIGCGLGLLGFYLRERGWHGHYLGVDFDASKIAEACRAVNGEANLAFDDGIAQKLPPFEGHVALLDVLHYLGRDEQSALLREAAARVAPGAALVVRSVLRDRGWRFRATVVEEWFLHALRWMRSPAKYYPLREDIEQPLLDAGLVVDVHPLWGRTPFNSFVIVARRPRT